jgi:hypothetical protein
MSRESRTVYDGELIEFVPAMHEESRTYIVPVIEDGEVIGTVPQTITDPKYVAATEGGSHLVIDHAGSTHIVNNFVRLVLRHRN